jgi:hypothetical protein
LEFLEGIQSNSIQSMFGKWIAAMVPGMAEMLECVHKVRRQYLQGEHTHEG